MPAPAFLARSVPIWDSFSRLWVMMPFGRLSFVLGAFFLAGGVASIASGKLMHAAQKTSPGGMLLFGALAPRADKPINICTVRCNLSAAAFFAVSALECPVWLLHRV